jgi:hypothetical protein
MPFDHFRERALRCYTGELTLGQELHPRNPIRRTKTARRVWRGVRVAEGARLESVFTSNRDVGSNPTLSAKYPAEDGFVKHFF